MGISRKLAKVIITFTAYWLGSSMIIFAAPDQYIEGYIQSLFVHNYSLPKEAVEVKDGIIYIREDKINGRNPNFLINKIKQASLAVEGVKSVRIKQSSDSHRPINTINHKAVSTKSQFDGALPSNPLFEPLIADPKWPRFSLAYHYYLQDKSLKQAFSPNFGASFGLYRVIDEAKNLEWEIGVQAGLFGLMDIGKTPSALINADYFVSIPLSYLSGPWSGLARLYHLSSHLGDEFMLTPEGKRTKRINLSYEGIDLMLSYNFGNTRIYGGGGYIIHKEPSYYKPLKVQVGSEYYFATTFWNGRLRPIAGIDIKAEEHSKWFPGISCKAGFQLENSSLITNKVQLMLEFFSGKSMHGQLYKNSIKYIGIGLHAFL